MRNMLARKAPGTARRGQTTALPRPARAPGLTLVELLIGVAITALIGAAIAAMLLAVSSSSSNQAGARYMAAGHGAVAARLGATIRCSKLVLAAGNGHIVLWVPTRSATAAPVLSELCRIEHDAATKKLYCYRAGADLPAADDVEYPLGSTDFDVLTEVLKAQEQLLPTTWAQGLATCRFLLGGNDPRQARFVGYRLGIESGEASATAVGGAALRN